MDSNLEVIEFNDKAIETILQNPNIKSIFFTSKFVEKEFMKMFPENEDWRIVAFAFSTLCKNEFAGKNKLL